MAVQITETTHDIYHSGILSRQITGPRQSPRLLGKRPKICATLSKWPILARHQGDTLQHSNPRSPTHMKYALLIHESPKFLEARKDPALQAAGMAYGKALHAAGIMITGAGLQPPQTATFVSLRDGEPHVHDGPFAETKEFLGGFVIIDVPDLDTAITWASRHPAAAYSPVEVRPLLGYF
jgi:hypothetical protein